MLEQSIQSLERLTGCSITIIDNDRVFSQRRLRSFFAGLRSSHQKNRVCSCGFDGKCIQFCRYEMNGYCLSLKSSEPFVNHCWKGLSEIVAPLNDGNVHYGMFYCGIWRSTEKEAPEGLPGEFYRFRDELPVLTPEHETELKQLCTVFADGIMFALRKYNLQQAAPGGSRSVKIFDFIRNHAVENIGLPDLARELQLSESRTSLLVKELYGKTFSELLQLERIGRAKQYLAATELRLHEIASLCGFYDEFHLSKVFKHHMGLSPRRWRDDNRQNLLI